MATNLALKNENLESLLERTTAGLNGCKEWNLYRDKDNYGKVKFRGTQRPAHRIALYLATGIMGEVAMHKCDNPPCINPEHLQWGTIADNNADMYAKGRNGKGEQMARRGSKSGAAKLSESEVIEIRNVYESGDISQREIARRYGVSHTMIQDIIKRKCWTHI